jgi:HPt (histidine-containing phosphotransfer) domain-containing protein
MPRCSPNCSRFRTDARHKLEELRQALAFRDAEGFARIAHCLKGMAATFAAGRAFAVSRELEELGRAGDLRDAAPVVSRLEYELGVLEQELSVLA